MYDTILIQFIYIKITDHGLRIHGSRKPVDTSKIVKSVHWLTG